MKNFLTSRQVAQLNQNKWNVNANGFYIDLYRDEFDEDVWEQICDQADVNYDIDKLTILSFGTIINE
jgi:hypothetical protein